MGILSRKITSFAKKIVDLPDRPGGTMTTAQLKVQFDSSPEELRVAHNGLVDDIASTTAGASGASQIGSETITGLTGNNVFAQISSLKTQINNAVTGQIPAGSIGTDKLSFDPATQAELDALIATKGQANGIASLGADGKVPTTQLPSTGPWETVANIVVDAAGIGQIDITGLSPYKVIKMYVTALSNTATSSQLWLRFDNDSGGISYTDNSTTSVAQLSANTVAPGNTQLMPSHTEFTISNVAANKHKSVIKINNAAGTAAATVSGGKWNNTTTLINSINILINGQPFGPGSTVVVIGVR